MVRSSGRSYTRSSVPSLHDQIIGDLPAVPWLRSKSLLHNRWEIGTEDFTKRRNTAKTIIFDVIVSLGQNLADPELEKDLITAKLIAFYSLSPMEGMFSSAASAAIFVRSYIQFVRWRLTVGITSNADLTEEWIEELFETIREKGIRGIIPLDGRAAEFARAVRSGEMEPPTFRKGTNLRFDFDAASKALGIPNGRLLTQRAQTTLVQLAAELGFKLEPYQVRLPGFSVSARGSNEASASNNPDREDDDVHSTGATSRGRVAQFLTPLQYLWKIRGHLAHDPIGVDPFSGERTPSGVGKAISDVQEQRTFTVPSLQACTLIDHALTWVLDYAPDIKSYVERLQDLLDTPAVRARWYPYRAAAKAAKPEFAHLKVSDALGSPWPIRAAYAAGKKSLSDFENVRPSLRTVLFEYLTVSCMIVIAAFSARRREEIESLRDTCISYDEGEPWLEAWIEKSIRDLDKIPIPISVVRAIEVLRWLSSTYRQRTGEQWLFCFDEVVKFRDEKPDLAFNRFDVYRSLDRFARFVDLPPLPDGSHWTPKPHQFRRFFGVTYYHHYRYAHLSALSNFYRHFDPDQTRRYVTEAARGGFLRRAEENKIRARAAEMQTHRWNRQRLDDFNLEGHEFRIERYRNVARGDETISGFGGEVIARQLRELIDQAKLQLDLSPSSDLPELTLDHIIKEYARGKRLEPNNLGHGYCKCTTDNQDLRSAACLELREVETDEVALFSAPDPAYAADYVCSGCPHNVQFEECEPYWARTIAHEQQQQRCALGPLMRALSLERLEMAQAHHIRCFQQGTT